jgi:hypothetical protein
MAAFHQINEGWNAEPNAPVPHVSVSGVDLLLDFLVNPFQFPEFEEEETAQLRFEKVRCYRLGPTNDEGWFRGQCRYSGVAPTWGEFYEISGDDDTATLPKDWIELRGTGSRHYLFYFRDETFECFADHCKIAQVANNALQRTGKKLRFLPVR